MGDSRPGVNFSVRMVSALPVGVSEMDARPRSMPRSMPSMGRANRISMAAAGMASHGCLMTVRAHLAQPLFLTVSLS